MNPINLLIVDDESEFRETLAERLELRDIDVTTVSSGTAALEEARKQDFDVALVDLKMPGMSGEELLAHLKKESPLTEIIILTGHGSVDSAVECLRSGSFHYLMKPCDIDSLMEVLTQAYRGRVEKKLDMDSRKMDEMLGTAMTSGSARSILDKLRELDED
jgi:DNA-binding NtrC family response regulator